MRTGQTLKEANAINTSLLTLGTVISKLATGDKNQHIPYRDSKLTHLLSSSLGGNASTTMIATISPAFDNKEESVNTLRYASRASKIVNDTGVNEIDNLDAFLGQYWGEIQSLKDQLQVSTEEAHGKNAELQDTRDEAERKVGTLRSQAEYLEQQLYDVQAQAAAEKERFLADIDALQSKLDTAQHSMSRQDAEQRQRQDAEREREAGQRRTEIEALRQQLDVEKRGRADEVAQLQQQVQAAAAATASAPAHDGPDESVALLGNKLLQLTRQLKDERETSAREVAMLRDELSNATASSASANAAVAAAAAAASQPSPMQIPLHGLATDDATRLLQTKAHELQRELEIAESEVEALRAQNDNLTKELDGNDPTVVGTGKRSASLTNTLILAQRELKEAQGEVDKLRDELVRARQEAISQGRAMAEELEELRRELRSFAAAKINRDGNANFDIPEGYVLWFHSNALPQIFSLASPENADSLLQPHPTAPVEAPNLPMGITVEVDENAVAVALQANEALQEQLERVVPSRLSERQFWGE